MRYFKIVLLLISIIFCFSFTKKQKTNVFEKTIFQVIDGFNEQDSAKINSLINKDIGLVVLYRPGAFDTWTTLDKVDFSKPMTGYMPYSTYPTNNKIQYGVSPRFDCDAYTWDKHGLYCDKNNRDTVFSTAVKIGIEWMDADVSDKQLKYYIWLEKNSRKITLCTPDDGDLIFYLTFIKNKWYLTLIDKVTSDCSA